MNTQTDSLDTTCTFHSSHQAGKHFIAGKAEAVKAAVKVVVVVVAAEGMSGEGAVLLAQEGQAYH